jgi:hypothetical protein
MPLSAITFNNLSAGPVGCFSPVSHFLMVEGPRIEIFREDWLA